MDKVIAWWGKGIFVSLCISMILLGTGPVDWSVPARRDQGVECFADDVFHVANLEAANLGPLLAARSSGFLNMPIPIPLVLFFSICDDILSSELSSRLVTIVIFFSAQCII